MLRKTLVFSVIILLAPVLASAADNPLADLVSGSITACSSDGGCIVPLLNTLFKAALSIGSMLAVLRIAYAGWLYMGASDMWGNKAQAIQVFQDAILGLLLLLGVWLILYQINPDILNLDFTRNFPKTG